MYTLYTQAKLICDDNSGFLQHREHC